MQPQDNQIQPTQSTAPVNPQPQQAAQLQATEQPYAPQTFAPQQPASGVVVSPSYPTSDATVSAPTPTVASVSDHKGSFLRKLALVVLAVLVVGGLAAGAFVAGGGLLSYNRSHATSAAIQYISFLNAGNDAKAYQASSSNLRNAQTEAQFANNLGDLTAKHPLFSNQTVQMKGNKAVYTATVDGLPATAAGRTDGVFTLALVKHGLSNWQVDSIQVE